MKTIAALRTIIIVLHCIPCPLPPPKITTSFTPQGAFNLRPTKILPLVELLQVRIDDDHGGAMWIFLRVGWFPPVVVPPRRRHHCSLIKLRHIVRHFHSLNPFFLAQPHRKQYSSICHQRRRREEMTMKNL